jgi:hypothetical protein
LERREETWSSSSGAADEPLVDKTDELLPRQSRFASTVNKLDRLAHALAGRLRCHRPEAIGN